MSQHQPEPSSTKTHSKSEAVSLPASDGIKASANELSSTKVGKKKKPLNLVKAILVSFCLTILFVILFLSITAVGVGFYAYSQAQLFSQAAQQPLSTIIETAKIGWKTTPVSTNSRVNILVLGTDQLANRGSSTTLTDTMLVASINLNTAQVSLLPIPRDLWLPDYQTKINALYVYGNERFPGHPEQFPAQVVSQLLNIPIHHTVTLNLETVGQIIDQVGGIDVEIKEGFVDPEFPRSDVDIQKVHDPAKLYMTVEFKAGIEHMNGERALQFIRSRHSTGDQGDDVARSQRQQQVISALITTLKKPGFYKDVARAGRLYHFYNQEFGQTLPMTELIGIGKRLIPVRNQLQLSTAGLTIFPLPKSPMVPNPILD